MKIALIRKDYLRTRGGGERYAVNLSRGLAQLGHEVHIFANRWDCHPHPEIRIHKVPTLTLFSSLKNLSFAYFCQKLIKAEQFDIVHSLSQTFPQDVYRMGDGIHRHWLCLQTPNRVFRFLKTLTPRQQVILFLEKKIFHPANFKMIICNSYLVKHQAMVYFKIPEEKLRVIYNGVDHSEFNPAVRDKFNQLVRKRWNIPEDAQVILFVARNFKRKGLTYLLRSLPLIPQKNRIILVVGKGNPAHFQQLAFQLGWGRRIIFVGETDNIAPYYGAADLLVLPTFYDPFSNVCLEALACCIPVVTTEQNGASEIIQPGETGIIVSHPHHWKQIAEGINWFLVKKWKELNRKKISESVAKFTIEGNTLKTLRVYEEVKRKTKS